MVATNELWDEEQNIRMLRAGQLLEKEAETVFAIFNVDIDTVIREVLIFSLVLKKNQKN